MPVTRWTPSNVIRPIESAHKPAAAAALVAVKAAAPRISGNLAGGIRTYPTARLTAAIDPYAVSYAGAVVGGARPHTIEATGSLLSTPYGVFRAVEHPGNRPNPFMRVALPAYRVAFGIAAGAGLRFGGLLRGFG